MTLRVYSHMLREHALGAGDVFAQAVKAAVSKPGLVLIAASRRHRVAAQGR